MTSPSPSIAIVGGGFSGTALATYLLEAGKPGLTVHVVESRSRLGWGVAYGDADDGHILNVPAARMTLWAQKPNDFLDWARHHGPSLGWPQAEAANAASYLPRRLFGHYVQARVEEAAARARLNGGPLLVRHATRVTAVVPDNGGFRLDFPSGGGIHAHEVVLATGFAPPGVPFPTEGESRRFIADPWATGALAEIGRDDSVLIIGTGLSMIDMIGSLERARHHGEVVVVSRHGLLPRIRGESADMAPLLNESDARRGPVHCLATLRRAIATGRADWRSAMDGLRPAIDILWRGLPPAAQDRFLRHLKPFWEVHRHRMPEQSAELLLRRFAKGTLAVEAARVQRLSLTADSVEAALRLRGTVVTRQRRFHWVINCTPPAAPLRATDTLRQALLAAGLARPDRTGMGFDIEPDGTLRGRNGIAVPGLFALGPLRRGHSIETTAVPHIRPQLEALTARLLSRAEPSRRAANS